MKIKIAEALKVRFVGVGEQILNRIADKLAKTVTSEEAVQAAVDAVTLQQVIDGEGDRRATEASNSAVSNYEKKHSLKEGKPVTGGGRATETEPDDKNRGTVTGGGADDVPAWAKALIDSNRALTDRLAGIEKDKLAGTRKQQLSTVVEKLPEALRKPYGRIDLAGMSDEEFTAFLAETTTEIGAIESDLAAKGAVVRKPGGGGGNSGKEATKEEAAAIVNDLL